MRLALKPSLTWNFILKRCKTNSTGGGLSWKTDMWKQGHFHRELPEGVKPTHIIVGAGSAGCVLVNFLKIS